MTLLFDRSGQSNYNVDTEGGLASKRLHQGNVKRHMADAVATPDLRAWN
jgi:hypothetical protein